MKRPNAAARIQKSGVVGVMAVAASSSIMALTSDSVGGKKVRIVY
jgi:hypothetical protein